MQNGIIHLFASDLGVSIPVATYAITRSAARSRRSGSVCRDHRPGEVGARSRLPPPELGSTHALAENLFDPV
jgi:hypothetical protein